MKIAVTYEDGKVFQHFGRTEKFKIYEIVDGNVSSSEIVGTDGAGHGALAGVLSEYGVEVLICGGMGQGARNALAEAGIEVCSGVSGEADEAVDAYLRGELESAGVTCEHHGDSCGTGHGDAGCGAGHGSGEVAGCGAGHESGADAGCGADCGSGDDDGCGAGCEAGCGSAGGCAGCGGAPTVLIEGPNAGKTCRVHYRGTYNDGTQFDSSYDRGEPMEFLCGVGIMIPGFDYAVAQMEPGQVMDVHLMPEEAYGMPSPEAVFTIEVAQVPGAENLEVGEQVFLSNSFGQFPVRVTAREGDTITFDANHEMAGKELNFRIELLEVLEG